MTSELARLSTVPAQAIESVSQRRVFTSNPAVVAKFIQQVEKMEVVDLADIRFIPARKACNLYVTIGRPVIAESLSGVIPGHQRMVEIELHADILFACGH